MNKTIAYMIVALLVGAVIGVMLNTGGVLYSPRSLDTSKFAPIDSYDDGGTTTGGTTGTNPGVVANSCNADGVCEANVVYAPSAEFDDLDVNGAADFKGSTRASRLDVIDLLTVWPSHTVSSPSFWVEPNPFADLNGDGINAEPVVGLGALDAPLLISAVNQADLPKYDESTLPGILLSTGGNVTVRGLKGTGNAYACVRADGTLYRSKTACA